MCGGKIFKTLRWVSVGKMVWSVSSYSEIVNEFLSPENLFGSQKSGRFGVRLIVARSSFRLAYNVFEINAGRAFSIFAISKNLKSNLQHFLE